MTPAPSPGALFPSKSRTEFCRFKSMTPWSFLFFSILVHVLIWLLVIANQHPQPKPKDNIEVTIVKQKDNFHPSQVVRQADVPKELLTDKKQKAKYLSEKDQFVKEEMRSKNSGLTQNKKDNSKKPCAQQRNMQKKPGKPTKEPLDLSDIGEKKSSNNRRSPRPQAAPSFRRRARQMDSVKKGAITALNEERFTYYSFFSRIEERVVPLWERNLKNTQDRMRPERRCDARWTTSLLPKSRFFWIRKVFLSGNHPRKEFRQRRN